MRLVVGVDEVGRGCWAGPLVAGAVILKRPIYNLLNSPNTVSSLDTLPSTSNHVDTLNIPTYKFNPNINVFDVAKLGLERSILSEYSVKDSKKLSKIQLIEFSKIIHQEALAIGLGWVYPETIDKIGLTASISIAMQDAVNQISIKFDKIIVDGNYNYLSEISGSETLIKADNIVPAVSAASIIAKVARDQYMIDASKKYPGYGFEKHVGYGTKKHTEALRLLGVCKMHRLSYKPVKQFVI